MDEVIAGKNLLKIVPQTILDLEDPDDYDRAIREFKDSSLSYIVAVPPEMRSAEKPIIPDVRQNTEGRENGRSAVSAILNRYYSEVADATSEEGKLRAIAKRFGHCMSLTFSPMPTAD